MPILPRYGNSLIEQSDLEDFQDTEVMGKNPNSAVSSFHQSFLSQGCNLLAKCAKILKEKYQWATETKIMT